MTRQVLESLPDWFGNPEAIEEYCGKVKTLPLWAALDSGGEALGILAADIHYGRTGEVIVMGVMPETHRKGVGRALYRAAEAYFKERGCTYAMVKTLSDIVNFAPYEKTRRFYKSMGFCELVTLREMWDEENPCLILLKEV